MAKSLAVRKIEKIGNRTFVEYTYGTPPLPSNSTGELSFADDEALRQQIQGVEDQLGEQGLLLLHLAITYLQSNGTFRPPQQVTNKTLNLDVYAANPLRIT